MASQNWKGGIFLFTDKRSRRLVLAAHCLLNQNAISDGTADYPGTHEEVARLLLEEGVGILQLPCPELCCLGLDRGDPLGASRPVTVENTRIRREMERPEAAPGWMPWWSRSFSRCGSTTATGFPFWASSG